MLKGLEERDFFEDGLRLFLVFIGEFDLLDHVIFILFKLPCQVGVAECAG
jgi:hypothetical protein